MKRLLLIMMTGTAIALSAGCGRQNGEGKDTVQTPAEALPDEVTKTDSEDIPGEDPVTDVYSYEDLYFDGYNNTDIMYKIPGINFSGAEIQKINSEIYDTLYHGIVEEEFANMSAGVSVICYEITYDWAVNGNILSLWITCNYDWEWTDYYVYNVDIKTEKEVSDADLIQSHGMSPEQYNDQVRKASVSPENAAQAKPFINENGELCIIGYMDSTAGADGYSAFPAWAPEWRTLTTLSTMLASSRAVRAATTPMPAWMPARSATWPTRKGVTTPPRLPVKIMTLHPRSLPRMQSLPKAKAEG